MASDWHLGHLFFENSLRKGLVVMPLLHLRTLAAAGITKALWNGETKRGISLDRQRNEPLGEIIGPQHNQLGAPEALAKAVEGEG